MRVSQWGRIPPPFSRWPELDIVNCIRDGLEELIAVDRLTQHGASALDLGFGEHARAPFQRPL